MIRPIVPDDGSLGPVGSVVLRWLTDTAHTVYRGVDHLVRASAGSGQAEGPAAGSLAGDGALLAVLALVLAVAALGIAVRTGRRVSQRVISAGRADR